MGDVMATGAFIVAIDVGSSSVRAILHDARARPVPGVEIHIAHGPRVRPDGTAELDADTLVALVARAVSGVLALAGPARSKRIAAVGLSTFWHGLVVADEAARPLTPVFLWSDSRSAEATAKLRKRLD